MYKTDLEGPLSDHLFRRTIKVEKEQTLFKTDIIFSNVNFQTRQKQVQKCCMPNFL